MPRRLNPLALGALSALAALLAVSACGSSDGSGSGGSGSSGTAHPSPAGLTLLTYDAFVEPEALKAFTEQTGITVTVAKGGDAGTLVNKAILTAGRPEGDVLW
ncbi:MAG TPA: hypothetical protein VID93_07410, partial [Acidimicrobiales bacterium]